MTSQVVDRYLLLNRLLTQVGRDTEAAQVLSACPLIESMRRGIRAKNDTWRQPARGLHKLLLAPIEAQMQAQKLAPENWQRSRPRPAPPEAAS